MALIKKLWGDFEMANSLGLHIWVCLAGTMVSLTGAAQAQKPNCQSPYSQYEMNICSERTFEAVDTQLNRAYKAAVRVARQLDVVLPRNKRGARIALRDAQRLWIKFRDQACDADAFVVRGGTLEPFVYNKCRTRLTHRRTKDLRAFAGKNN